MLVYIFFTLIVCICGYYILNRKWHNCLPGPTPLPIIGNLHTIGTNPHIACGKWAKEYGKIFQFKFGPDRAICVHGTKLIKEATNNPAFAGRQDCEARSFIAGGKNGIFLATGDTWSEQRRFALRNLRDFGFGKSSMEELIMDEVREVIDWLKAQNGSPVELQDRLSLAVVNSLWRICTGERFPHDDAKLHKILNDLQASAKAILQYNSFKSFIIFFCPSIAKIFSNWSGWSRLTHMKAQRVAMYTRIIDDHTATFQEDAPRDFVDVYLKEVKRTTNPTSSFHPKTGADSLKAVMADFFIAGSDTTSLSLSWLSLYLLHYPRVQKKVHEELDRVVGRSRAPRLSDRKSLPYLEAVILETMRLSSIAPFLVHAAMQDTTIDGYNISKGTVVFTNLYANHHDPEIWGENVEEFVPERFLSPDGTTVLQNEALLPFSFGKRACLGEPLARDSVFLFAANLAHNFEVDVAESVGKPPLEFKKGHVTLPPVSTTVVMRER